ncbi:acyl-CoA dehydrogenase [Oricola cellulosilytica]|uniref:3-methylmercaptopropionyl-CoA dehydrogenase n=1 Tax=Oricola cellulosilytica TaxID=1429082 RepID=A0A4R0P8P2_9HYPH|nr:acyl-CoA dehydrogenase [Oricola cellulosilytica]TCD13442.1 acyl-CoA dehydrogenase [Oricola cellulosilytica]
MYRAPVAEISHTLKSVAGLSDALENGLLGDLGEDLVNAILEEAGRFASEEIAPLHQPGDLEGAKATDGSVTMPEGYKKLYADWTAGGWNGLAADPEYGGQGLPMMMSMAATEMWNAASMAFGLVSMLTTGAVEALEAHASDELKAKFLEKMISGEWTGTMNLTEPQAGSDLSALKARAERADDGTYRLFGQKIFITFGEHDLTENIVHLVLARLPDAPAGTRGISLFLVPKFLVNEDGTLGERNDVICHSIEHKLGIHASPTCTMIYGDGKFGDGSGAVGYLVGEENRGLACMFTMMNNARLAVGVQGVAVAEAATQKALEYANERRQGKAPDWSDGGMSLIVLHPDVQRDLLTMSVLTRAARSICYACAHAVDMAGAHDGDEARFWNERASLLTPVAKSFSTDIGSQVASIGVQVHGGMGFIEETGAAIYMRDARIGQIYEGTNGIQAIDLVMRKLPLSDGESVNTYFAELDKILEDLKASNNPAFGDASGRLTAAMGDLRAATEAMTSMTESGDTASALAGATPYLRLFGLTAGGVYLAKSALAESSTDDRATMCRFFAENLVGETASLRDTVENGAASLGEAAQSLVA